MQLYIVAYTHLRKRANNVILLNNHICFEVLKMKCENNLCIYQYKDKCLLDKINIDSLGMCTECIHPDIDEVILKQAKIKHLKKYELENPF